MTTNIAESFNRVLKGVRSLPLCAIIELTFCRTAEYFRDYGNQADECTTRFAPRVHTLLDARRAKAQHHRTRIFDRRNNEFEVLCKRKYASAYSVGDTVQQCNVGPMEAKCTCNKPKLEHIPCSHVLAACKELGGNDGGHYVSWFYTTEALRNTWRPKMHSYAVGSSHKTIEGPNWAPYPATKRTEPGRRRSHRIHGDMDEADATHGLRKCKICKQPGHDRRNCPQRQ